MRRKPAAKPVKRDTRRALQLKLETLTRALGAPAVVVLK